MKMSNKITIIQNEDYSFAAFHENYPSIIYTITNDVCNCNMCTFAGYPCSHLIKFYSIRELGFPLHLIHKRWLKNEIEEEHLKQLIDEISHKEEEDNVDDDDDDEDEMNDNDSIEEIDLISDKERYLKLFHKGKELAKLASRDSTTFKKAEKVLQHEINEILQIPTETFIQEDNELIKDISEESNAFKIIKSVNDADGKPKGAPKKQVKKQNHQI